MNSLVSADWRSARWAVAAMVLAMACTPTSTDKKSGLAPETSPAFDASADSESDASARTPADSVDLGPDANAEADVVDGSDATPPQDGATAGSGDADASPATLPTCATSADCSAPGFCWLGYCSSAGTCGYAPKATGSACDDGNACTMQDNCSGGVCTGQGQANCDDGEACTLDGCQPESGCVHLAADVSSSCEDGNPCTAGDQCIGQKCAPGLSICACQTHADCAAQEDGDLCNGTLYCDKSAGPPFACKVNPATIVSCPTVQNSACQTNLCLPALGQCKLVTAPLNTPCQDGDACTTGDHCDSGSCQGGTNTCFCKQDSDCLPQEDGNLCNGSLFCNKATASCQLNPVTVVTCHTSDDTQCKKNLCNPKDGKCQLVAVNDAKVCDDGNPCTPNEACLAGDCFAGANTCQCQKDADCAAKEDGNLCNGTLYCDLKDHQCKINPATVVACDASGDGPCEATSCQSASGKCATVTLPLDGSPCDDGDSCTADSSCLQGACQGGISVCACQTNADCAAQEDGDLCNGTLYCDPKTKACKVNPATAVNCPTVFNEACLTLQCQPKTGNCAMAPAHQGNQCDGATACSAGGWCSAGACVIETVAACECTQDKDCAKFEDGDLCNGTLYCDKTATKPSCKVNPATAVVCPTAGDGPCALTSCQPSSGKCLKQPKAGLCDDGLTCTQSDACQLGNCTGGPKACVDSLPCTSDNCVEPFGCVHLPNSASPCDDGSACTVADACLGGQCVGKPKACDDGNPCTTDSCHGELGCLNQAHSGPCTDQDPCTGPDICSKGGCVPGPTSDCDDGSLCTKDSCDPVSGNCKHSDVAAAVCDDKNACTVEICDQTNGCGHSFVQGGCSDGSPCTLGDTCSGGACIPGKPFACSDNQVCTDDYCDPKLGCVFAPNKLACDDNNLCTGGDACKGGTCTAGITKTCDDANPCTAEACNAATGACDVTATTLSCDDGNACTSFDQCAKGVCAGKPVFCDDANTCTDDGCDAQQGCQFAANNGTCDLKSCTLDLCANGLCQKGSNSRYFQTQISAPSKANFYADARMLVSLPAGQLAFAAGDSCGGGIGSANAAGQATMHCGGCGQGFYMLHQRDGKVIWPTNQQQIKVFSGASPGYGSQCPASATHQFFGLRYILRMADWGTGYLAVGYSQIDATNPVAYKHRYGAMRLSAEFKVDWQWSGGTEVADTGHPSSTQFTGAAVAPGGGSAVAVGGTRATSASSSESIAAVSWMSADSDHKEFFVDGGDFSVLHDVTVAEGGGYVACGSLRPSGTNHTNGWLVWLSDSGAVTAQRDYGGQQNDAFREIERLPDGTLVVAGSQASGASQPYGAWLVGLDRFGNVRWQRTFIIQQTQITGLLAQSDGSLAMTILDYPAGSTFTSYVARRDRWGYSSCVEAGLCTQLTSASCADLDPCTIDSCDAALGCTHVPMAAGAPCGDGATCNSAGECAPP